MAEFQIKSKDGTLTRATGSPVYNGTYLKPAYLEFQEIASPVPISWQVGDYVDYTRTGLRYKLYNIPKSRKQGERNLYGGSFVYENVQLYDITKELELAPFVDLVPYDNEIHFSTLNSVAFVGTPANVAERVQACLNFWFPSSNWVVNVVTGLDPSADAELVETLSAEAEFSVSGTSCQGVMDKIYDTWNGLGYSYSQSNGNNVITIGAPNKRTLANTTASYGRINDNGIVTLARSVSNSEEMGTRLYAYGSMRNMPTSYYRSKDIKDAESVDIEHLMLPIDSIASLDYDGWGKTDTKPDARKAYIENTESISKFGLIPKYAYFDGSDASYPEIYPSLEGVTIGEVIDGKAAMSDTSYVPSLSKWNRYDRVDEIVSAVNPVDDGGASSGGSQYSESGTHVTDASSLDSSLGQSVAVLGTYSPTDPADTVKAIVSVSGTVEVSEDYISELIVAVRITAHSGISTVYGDLPIELHVTNTQNVCSFELSDATLSLSLKDTTQVDVSFVITKIDSEIEFEADINAGTVFLGFASSVGKTFTVSIPQIGFNLLQYADMGDGKTLSMKSGMCVGRDFPIKAATYVSSSDTWKLTLSRVKDSDTGLYYPNSDFQIEAGDKYVLLDIAMPELYITMASIRLLKAAQKLLADIDHEKPFYEPEIDSKKVYIEERVLREGMWMHLVGDEIVDNGEDYSIIDTLQIDEGASNIPVYSVTLREKKPVEWTESISASVSTTSSKSVDDTVSTSSGGSYPDWLQPESYTENNVTKYRLKVNPKYELFYADGPISAGGISDTSGQVTVVASLSDLSDVDDNLNPSSGQYLYFDGTEWTSHTLDNTGTVTSVKVGDTTYNPVSGVVTLPAYPTTLPASDVYSWAKASTKPSYTLDEVSDGSTRKLSNYLPLSGGASPVHFNLTNLPEFDHAPTYLLGIEAFADGGTMKWSRADACYVGYATNAGDADLLDGLHASSFASSSDVTTLQGYFTNGVANQAARLSDSSSYTAWGQTYFSNGVPATISGDMTSVGKMTFTAQSTASASGNILEVVTIDGQQYLHSVLPFYSDSSVSAGGISGSGGGGAVGYLGDLGDVTIGGDVSAGDFLRYYNGEWTNAGIDLSGYVPTSRTVNGKALTSNITLNLTDLGDVDGQSQPSDGEVLMYNSGVWGFGTVASGGANIFYGTCSTMSTSGGGSKDKVVDCDDFESSDLTPGTIVIVFAGYGESYGTASSRVTFNINSTGAHNAISNTTKIVWSSGEILILTYTSGNQWYVSPTYRFITETASGGGTSGSTVTITNRLTTGTRIATFTIDANVYDLYAPTSGGSAEYTAGTGLSLSNYQFSLTKATTSSLGGVKMAAVRTFNPTLITGGSSDLSDGRYYGVEMASNGKLFVHVPWTSSSGGGSTVTISDLLPTGTIIAKLTIDGIEYDLKAPTSGGGDPSTYVTLNTGQTISGEKTFTAATHFTNRVYLSNSVYIEVDSNGYLHTNGNFYADGFVSAGGVSNTSS